MRKILTLIIISSLFISAAPVSNRDKKIPIIYSKKYNIKLFGIQKFHSFDTQKYGKVYKYLKHQLGYKKYQFYSPKKVSKAELLTVHTDEYLKSLRKSKNIAEIAEVPFLKYIPNCILRRKILRPMKYATGGTILGADIALKYGYAINLSGGYHHAKSDSGEGFCFYSDIILAVNRLLEYDTVKSILIVDLDAHQGNGYETIIKNKPGIYIFDVYNKDIFPNDEEAVKYIDFNFPVSRLTKDKKYLSIIEIELPEAIEKCKPDFIIYNAGTDIYRGDRLGLLSVSSEGIIKRDDMVFKFAKDRNIPVLMLLSGGYSKKSSGIIGKSLVNIIKKQNM